MPNFKPKTSVSNRLSLTAYKALKSEGKPGILDNNRIKEKVK